MKPAHRLLAASALIVAAAAVVAVIAPVDASDGSPTVSVSRPAVPPDVADRPLPRPPVAAAPAVRITTTSTTPPSTLLPVFADDCAEMSWYRQQVGLPAEFDRLGWRESNCRNEDAVRTFCCHGWWQLYVSMHLSDHRLAPRYHACGVRSADDINSDTPDDKARQACAAKALYDVVGLSAWSLG